MDRQTDRRKATQKSPTCISTGWLNINCSLISIVLPQTAKSAVTEQELFAMWKVRLGEIQSLPKNTQLIYFFFCGAPGGRRSNKDLVLQTGLQTTS